MFESVQALAEPNRFAILQLLQKSEMSAGKIAKNFKDITRPAVSQHLGVLKNAGLIVERREGTSRIYRVCPEGFSSLRSFLEGFWDSNLEKLKTAAEKEEKKKRRKL
ncbi:MAG: winged helix-turn-helix transcriptional regulator [Nitrospinae bacterium]|nr:winged helix-turn-helix transcriptional regulator [Nitrospinota bacterium]